MLTTAALSSSYAAFEAELEESVWEQAAAVDSYLQAAPPAWSLAPWQQLLPDRKELQQLFQADLASDVWQHSVKEHVRVPHQQNAQVELCSVAHATPASSALVSSLPRSGSRRRRAQPLQLRDPCLLDSYLSQSLEQYLQQQEQVRVAVGSPAGTPPPLDAVDECSAEALAPPAAVAVAAAAAAAAAEAALTEATSPSARVLSLAAVECSRAQDAGLAEPANADRTSSTPAGALGRTAVPGSAAGPLQSCEQQAPAPSSWAAEQRELRPHKAAAHVPAAAAGVPCPSELAAAKAKGLEAASLSSLHAGPSLPLVVPERPRGLRPAVSPVTPGVEQLKQPPPDGDAYLGLLYILLACTLLLPLAAWALGNGASALGASSLQAAAGALLVPLGALLVLVPGGGLAALQVPLLQFSDSELEARFSLWLGSMQLAVDACVHCAVALAGMLCWLSSHGTLAGLPAPAAGVSVLSAAGRGRLLEVLALAGRGMPAGVAQLAMVALLLPLAASGPLLFLRSRRYLRHRERMMVAARLCSTAALLWLHGTAPGLLPGLLSAQGLALLEAGRAACMHVRLLAYLPTQVLHVVVLAATLADGRSGLELGVQLAVCGLSLPCLLVYGGERWLRNTFLTGARASAGAA